MVISKINCRENCLLLNRKALLVSERSRVRLVKSLPLPTESHQEYPGITHERYGSMKVKYTKFQAHP